jgi:hypothetical protein
MEKGEMKGLKVVVILLFMTFLFPILISHQTIIANAQGAGTGLYVSPSIYVAKGINETFVMSVNVSQASRLHSVQIRFGYNQTFLKAISVGQGTFFPSGPSSNFKSKINQAVGLVQVNISLVNAGASLNGNGTLIYITLTVIAGTTGNECVLTLNGSRLLDPNGTSLAYDSLDALYFWRLILEDPTVGAYLDIFTQRAGRGPNVLGGIFNLGQFVNLMSAVTYNGYPVMNKLVAFVALNPTNNTVVYMTGVTNASGIATVSFRIPDIPSSVGYWTCVSVADVDGKVVWDTTRFWALPAPHPVGGYSISKSVSVKEEDYVSYGITAIFLLGFFVFVSKNKRKTRTKFP